MQRPVCTLLVTLFLPALSAAGTPSPTPSAAAASTAGPSSLPGGSAAGDEPAGAVPARRANASAAGEPRSVATPGAGAAASGADADLEAELERELGQAETTPTPAAARAGALRLMDLSLNGLFAAGFSSAEADAIGLLHGGGHDPRQNGFTVQNLELTLLGAVDPYLRAQTHVILLIDEEGETVVELEEAYLTTQTLPHGLQVKAGHFFTEVGRLNPQHPHTWAFADQPVVNTRLFGGDGLRAPGARLSWLMPLPWYGELLAGVQNARGETAFSFLGSDEEGGFAGFAFVERPVDGPEDLLWSLRTLHSFELSAASTLNLGASALFGPNATGETARTSILGADAYVKWARPGSYRGYPFVSWQAELLVRSYEVGRAEDPETGETFETDLSDWGLYSQVLWGFRPGWVLGSRIDVADGELNEPLFDRRLRLSASLTRYPTEFSKIRLQYNLDRAEHLDDELEHSVWVQFEFLLGAHGAHKF